MLEEELKELIQLNIQQENFIASTFNMQLIKEHECQECKPSFLKEPLKHIRVDINSTVSEEPVLVTECLRQMYKSELKQFQCENCYKLKKSKNAQLPHILVIHIQRLVHSNFEVLQVNKKVKIPSNLGWIMKKYDLEAIISHFGDPNRGHWVCDLRKDGSWFTANDENVMKICDVNDLLSRRQKVACVLFYKVVN